MEKPSGLVSSPLFLSLSMFAGIVSEHPNVNPRLGTQAGVVLDVDQSSSKMERMEAISASVTPMRSR